MGVVWCKRISGRSGSGDQDTNHRYTVKWQVYTDDPNDGQAVVLNHGELPDYGDPYEELDADDGLVLQDLDSVLVSLQVEQDADNPLNWTVTGEYVGIEDPTAQPADVDYQPTRYQEALIDDVNDKPVQNCVGDPFQQGITVDRTRFTLILVQNVLDWDAVDAAQYQDSLNEQPFLADVHAPGFAAGTCKLTLGATRVRRLGTTEFYWRRRAEIDIKPDGWTIRVREAGFNEVRDVGMVSKKVPIILPFGGKPSTPYPLDPETQQQLGLGEDPATADFEGYRTKDWDAIDPPLTY